MSLMKKMARLIQQDAKMKRKANGEEKDYVAYDATGSGIVIHDIPGGDGVIWSYNDGKKEESEIEYEIPENEDEDSRAYFMAGERIVYLDECVRVNSPWA